jgi:putative transposase
MTAPLDNGPAPRRASQEWRDHEVRRLRAIRKANNGVLPDRDVREAGRRLGLSTRHVRRLVNDPSIGTNRDDGYVADEAAFRALAAAGSIENAHKLLAANGFQFTPRTLARGYERAPKPRVEGARHGYQAYLGNRLSLPGETSGRLSVVAMDHKQLPNLVLPDRRSKPVFPWLCTLLDHETRLILASTLVVRRPNTEIVVATFTEGVAGWWAEDGTWVGGKPGVLLTDNGTEFQTEAVAERLTLAGILREFAAPFASRQNGRIERWHETVEAEFCKTMPAYHEGDKDEVKDARFGRKYGDFTPWPRYVRELRAWIRHYNEDRPHSRLGGKTPVQAWADDPTPIIKADPEQLRLCMMSVDDATVNPEGIRHRTIDYLDAEGVLRDLVRSKVDVRYLPNTYDRIEVYRHDRHLCTAYPVDHLTAEQRLRIQSHVTVQSTSVLATDEAARQMRLARAGITETDDGWDDDLSQTADDTGTEEGVDTATGEVSSAAGERIAKESEQAYKAKTHRKGPSKREDQALADVAARLGVPSVPIPAPPLHAVPDLPDAAADDTQETQ